MRTAIFWAAALALHACAHRSPAGQLEPAYHESRSEPRTSAPESEVAAAGDSSQEQSQPIFERAHPPHEVTELDRPPARAAIGPRSPQDGTAELERAAPAAGGSGPLRVELETTDPPSSQPVSSPTPASARQIRAPVHDAPTEPAPSPGADIAKADAELRERVQRELGRSPSLSYTAKHVQVEVVDRRVTLRGEVRNAHERRELDEIVRALPGVKQLRNRVALINRPGARPAR